MPALSANALRRWTTIHRWTSLFCTLNLTVLAITGLILIFRHEIDDALGTVPEVKSATGQMLPLGQLVDAALKVKPGWSPMTYAADDDHPGRVFIFLAPPGVKDFAQAKPVIFNGYTGDLFEFDFDKTFTGFVFNLHANLFLGPVGELYLALVGLSFFAALVSGALIYAPFLRGLLFGALRRERGTRVFQLDLHNLVGVVTLVWCSVVALTGVVLELSRPILAYYQMSDLAKMTAPFRGRPAPQSIVPLEKAAAAAESAWPGHRIDFALFPGTPLTGEHHYTFFMASGSGISKRVLKLAMIDASDASVTTASESPWYIKALFVSGPLHFGDYAGMPLKIIWALFTLLTVFLCGSGVYLWIARLRIRKAVVPETVSLPEEVAP
jgi:uncharacterized iron-regulated membrane protein